MNEHLETMGMGGLFLTAFLGELTKTGQDAFASVLAQQPLPPHWTELAEPRLSISGSLMLGVEDIKHVMQLLPFVMTPSFLHLPPLAKDGASQQRKSVPAVQQHVATFTVPAIQKYHRLEMKTASLQSAAVAAAMSQKLVYAKKRAAGSPEADAKSLDELHEALIAFRRAMLEIFPDLCNRVNFLYGRHFREAVRSYGVAALLSVCVEEFLHGLYNTVYYFPVMLFAFVKMLLCCMCAGHKT